MKHNKGTRGNTEINSQILLSIELFLNSKDCRRFQNLELNEILSILMDKKYFNKTDMSSAFMINAFITEFPIPIFWYLTYMIL